MHRDAISCLEILDHLGLSRHIRRDSLAEWSKAPDLGFGPKGCGFKSHNCHDVCFDFLCIAVNLMILRRVYYGESLALL